MIPNPFENERTDKIIIGVDEVGRGAVAGPAFVAACIVDVNAEAVRLLADDSKKLSAKKRENAADKLQPHIVCMRRRPISVEKINKSGVHTTITYAMKQAVMSVMGHLNLDPTNVIVAVDGNCRIGGLPYGVEQIDIVRGDGKSLAIATASIMAKVYRDNVMCKLAEIYDTYELDKNKGYGTRTHKTLLRLYGVSPIHRLKFVQTLLSKP